jgi:hypothetical protein
VDISQARNASHPIPMMKKQDNSIVQQPCQAVILSRIRYLSFPSEHAPQHDVVTPRHRFEQFLTDSLNPL